ncbi:AMP-binding protein [Paraburkholderia sp. JPY169]|uniref:AMP-binding protein n=1 Tax=Paraburkholderia youngii TaxID=2782701 RepID=A0A7Y6N4X8_9BURK|nr:AMP-binding protein [Paraburkholderia youngii]
MALVHENERLSYGELNARANRLAHHLIALGVRPDQPVGICVERSAAMVVGLLAILKAGAHMCRWMRRIRGRGCGRLWGGGAAAGAGRWGGACGVGRGGAGRGEAGGAGGAVAGVGRAAVIGSGCARAGPGSAPSGLCDLHVGLHRHAQGRHG